MSRIFGPVMQMGYIVRDIDAALAHWTQVLGVGPFVTTPLTFEYYRLRGVPSAPELKVAFSYSGNMQIELIQQVNDAPSAYKEFLDREGAGLHHVCMFCESYDLDTQRFERDGLPILMEGKTAASVQGEGVRFKFYDIALHNGCYVEVADIPTSRQDGFTMLQQAAAGWDGTDPVRPIG